MSIPTRKQSRFDGGRRPWSGQDRADRDEHKIKYTLNQAEIDQCLNCTKPEQYCFGSCAIKNEAVRRRPKKPMPEDFQTHYLSGARMLDLAAYYEVSKTTLYRWIRDAGLTRRSEDWKRTFWKKNRR